MAKRNNTKIERQTNNNNINESSTQNQNDLIVDDKNQEVDKLVKAKITNANLKAYTFEDASKMFLYDIVVKNLLVFILIYIVMVMIDSKGFVYNEYLASHQLVAYLLTLISPLVLMCVIFMFHKNNKIKIFENLKSQQKTTSISWIIVIIIPLIVFFMGSGVFNSIEHIFSSLGMKESALVFKRDNIWKLLASIFSMALLPAIFEEIVYRGVVLKGLLSKFKPYVAIITSAVLFMFMHGSIAQTFYQLFLGLIFGFVVYKTGNILLSMIMHFVNNATILIVDYINSESIFLVGGDFSSVWYIISQILLFIGLIGMLLGVGFYFSKCYNKREELNKENKFGFSGFVTKSNTYEKLMFFGGLVIAVVIWIVGTVMSFGA